MEMWLDSFCRRLFRMIIKQLVHLVSFHSYCPFPFSTERVVIANGRRKRWLQYYRDFMASERVTDGEYRDIIGFLVARDLSFTGRKQRNGKKLSPRIDFLFSPFPDFHASIALLPQILRCCLAINLAWKTAGETKRDPPPPRRRCIAGNCDRSSNKTNWFIAFSVQSRRARRARPVHALSILPAIAGQFICDRN